MELIYVTHDTLMKRSIGDSWENTCFKSFLNFSLPTAIPTELMHCKVLRPSASSDFSFAFTSKVFRYGITKS